PKLLSYYIDGGIVHITTIAKADAQMVTMVYPVHDLMLEIPNFKARQNNNSSDSSTEITVGGDSASSGSTSSGLSLSADTSTDDTATPKLTAKERSQSLIDLIQATIRPEIWEANGGKARIRYFNGNLIITAPITVHQLIGIGY